MKPIPGMGSRVEHLLRFELFIPHVFDDWYREHSEREYVDAAGDERLAVAVLSNDTLQMSVHKPPKSPTSTAFFRRIALADDVKLPPVIWFGFMRTAKDDGAFAPIDIDSLDDFPLRLCRYVNVRPRTPDVTVLSVAFEIAILYCFPKECHEELTVNMLNVISTFDRFADKTSFPPTFTFPLAFVRYVLHRVSLVSSFDDVTKDAILDALANLASFEKLKNLSDDQVVALSDLVEDIVVHSLVFKVEHEWTRPQMYLVEVYSVMVGASSSHRPGCGYSPRHDFWPALRALVEFLIHQYDAPYHEDDPAFPPVSPFNTMCKILEFGLKYGVRTVYDVFLEMRCLNVFGNRSLRPSLVGVINGYVAGLAAPDASINSQHHLDYLHEPENLFLACCIITTNGWKHFREMPYSTKMLLCSDIRALAGLRPSDPSWDHCRRKLRDLLLDDRGDFFVTQQKWTNHGFEVLKPEDIDQAKSNISLALCELDDFFSGSMNTNVRSPTLESTARRFLGGINRYLPYPRHREKDDVQV
ncbi:hypothetical protein EDD18DRAFT_1333007 [Armillaria luteobubalina]|uniref:Uncharacterized protein n=1 Tax=Armillaria luteobubalina TaxID=153913 RepID=A0AA39UMM0_9AGAR|nr:hypothetical protein EDD18DRAFT_1333007 [Armillaria luteobubalina]